MPAVLARPANKLLFGVALALTLLVLVTTSLLSIVAVVEEQSSCAPEPVGGPPGPGAKVIPVRLMPIYRAAERAYGVPWNVLAAINKVETDFGRNLDVSSAGAVGWMQFMPDTWARYGVDANDDGRKDPYEPEDAIFAAANYLRASDAPQDLRRAILAYNHAEWYYQEVMAWARRFAQGPITVEAPASGRKTTGYPLARHAPIIAIPVDHRARALGNWQSDNAVDFGVPAGTPVLAVENGTVTRTGGSPPSRGSGVIGGYSVTLQAAENTFFYTHLAGLLVHPGQRLTAGQEIGKSGYANGVDHLHIGVEHGDPMALWGGGAESGLPTGCTSGSVGVPDKVLIAPGANLPGRPIAPETLAFVAQVAGIYGKPLVVTTGTNHSKFTVDGNVSDHFSGHAVDIGMAANGGADDSPIGDAIAAAALVAAGEPPAQAAREAREGGLFNRIHGSLRIQVIWKTDEGGNHHNHVHIGVRPSWHERTADPRARPEDGRADHDPVARMDVRGRGLLATQRASGTRRACRARGAARGRMPSRCRRAHRRDPAASGR